MPGFGSGFIMFERGFGITFKQAVAQSFCGFRVKTLRRSPASEARVSQAAASVLLRPACPRKPISPSAT